MPLCRLLKARHGDRPADHWAEMTAAMNDVKTMEIACAWIQRGTSYCVSTCRSTKIHEDKRIAKLEDYFGNVTCKEINRPSIRHNLCEVLLKIDEHDRMRKNVLGLERKWLTKDFKFRLLTTASALSVVGMHRWCRSMKFK